ncbi:hypothetical protein J53TS2_30890 [Paenibacillus sp. J53TS2]|nr:hypothetical protein J53TS2_30890 [Paenibacillus sp. J53TS2]
MLFFCCVPGWDENPNRGSSKRNRPRKRGGGAESRALREYPDWDRQSTRKGAFFCCVPGWDENPIRGSSKRNRPRKRGGGAESRVPDLG